MDTSPRYRDDQPENGGNQRFSQPRSDTRRIRHLARHRGESPHHPRDRPQKPQHRRKTYDHAEIVQMTFQTLDSAIRQFIGDRFHCFSIKTRIIDDPAGQRSRIPAHNARHIAGFLPFPRIHQLTKL